MINDDRLCSSASCLLASRRVSEFQESRKMDKKFRMEFPFVVATLDKKILIRSQCDKRKQLLISRLWSVDGFLPVCTGRRRLHRISHNIPSWYSNNLYFSLPARCLLSQATYCLCCTAIWIIFNCVQELLSCCCCKFNYLHYLLLSTRSLSILNPPWCSPRAYSICRQQQ